MENSKLSWRLNITLPNGESVISERFADHNNAMNAREDMEKFFPDLKVAIIGQIDDESNGDGYVEMRIVGNALYVMFHTKF